MTPTGIPLQQIHERVRIGPPPDWAVARAVDEAWRPPEGVAASMLLIDHQHHAPRHEAYRRVVQRMETMAGVHQAAQWTCDFDPSTQHVTIHSLVVRRGAEAKEQAALERLRFIQREENLERYMLDGWATVVVLLEDVRVGDIIDASYTVHTRARIFPDHFATLTAVPTDCHARLFHLSVRFPAGHPLRWQTDSKIIQLNERTLDGGDTEWSWQVENFTPREPEPNMPHWYFQGRFIQITDFPSWEAVAAGVAAAWPEDFAHPELVAAAQKLAALPTLEERVEGALRLVQDEIRYLSVNTELGGQIPSGPGLVLQRRFGDCKDKAFLLAHLLRLLGVSARPVLVHAGFCGKVAQFLPMPAAFNHAIVEYELAGERRWVDPTIPLQGGGPARRALPRFEKGLPLGAGVTDLEPIVSPEGSTGTYKLLESFYFETRQSPLLLSALTTATGRYADDLRRQLALDGSPALIKAREQFYQRLFPGSARYTDLQWYDDRERNELKLADVYTLPEKMGTLVQPGLLGFETSAHVIQSALAFPDSEMRRHPLGVPFPCHLEHEIECAFETPRGVNLRVRSGKTSVFQLEATSTRVAAGQTTFHLSLETFTDHVLPADFPTYRDPAKTVLAGTLIPILFPSMRTASDCRRSMVNLPSPKSAPPLPAVLEPAVLGETAPSLGSLPPEEQAMAPSKASSAPSKHRRPSLPQEKKSRRKRKRTRLAVYISAGLVALALAIVIGIVIMLARSH